MKGAEHPIGESDQEYKMGRALPVKYSEYFGVKRRESLKNENIRCDMALPTNITLGWKINVGEKHSSLL